MGMNLDSGELLAVKQVLIGASSASKEKAQLPKDSNILKGCIKLADFGTSKPVAKMEIMIAAKSMRGTLYWMAPEVTVQSGHSFSSDIWSVGCTVIEMATGKPPWSQQYQEVAALFRVGTTKLHHPFHSIYHQNTLLLRENIKIPLKHSSNVELSTSIFHTFKAHMRSNFSPTNRASTTNDYFSDDDYGRGTFSAMLGRTRSIGEINTSGDMCRFEDDKDDFPVVGSSFNPMLEPFDDWPCKFDMSPDQQIDLNNLDESVNGYTNRAVKGGNDFTLRQKLGLSWMKRLLI